MSDDFDAVAGLIGQEFSKGFQMIAQNILDAVNKPGGPTGTFAMSSGGVAITSAMLNKFFDELGGIEVGIKMFSSVPKTTGSTLTPAVIKPSPITSGGASTLGVNATIGIGITVTF